jgi:hypothetical protein
VSLWAASNAAAIRQAVGETVDAGADLVAAIAPANPHTLAANSISPIKHQGTEPSSRLSEHVLRHALHLRPARNQRRQRHIELTDPIPL